MKDPMRSRGGMAAKDPAISHERVKEILSYCPETGGLRRNGREIGYVSSSGYLRFSLAGRMVGAHRVAWFLTYGEWPKGHVDHVNGNRLDNRIANLRCASVFENAWNRPSFSGSKGACFEASRGKWRAVIEVCGRRVHLGYFPTEELAAAAYIGASKLAHGNFARALLAPPSPETTDGKDATA